MQTLNQVLDEHSNTTGITPAETPVGESCNSGVSDHCRCPDDNCKCDCQNCKCNRYEK